MKKLLIVVLLLPLVLAFSWTRPPSITTSVINGSINGTVRSISQGAGLIVTPNPLIAYGTIAVDYTTFSNTHLHDASNITTGIFADELLSVNIPRLNQGNNFTALWNTFQNAVLGYLNVTAISGVGSNLTSLNASQISIGTLAQARIPDQSNLSKHSIDNITGLLASQQCTGTNKVTNVTFNSSGWFATCAADIFGGSNGLWSASNITGGTFGSNYNTSENYTFGNGLTINGTLNLTKQVTTVNVTGLLTITNGAVVSGLNNQIQLSYSNITAKPKKSTLDTCSESGITFNSIAPVTVNASSFGVNVTRCMRFTAPMDMSVGNMSVRTVGANAVMQMALYNDSDNNRIFWSNNVTTVAGITRYGNVTTAPLYAGSNYSFCVKNQNVSTATAIYATIGGLGSSVLPAFFNVSSTGFLNATLNSSRTLASDYFVCGLIGNY